MSLGQFELSATKQLFVFSKMRFNCSEFVEQLVVLQNLEVLYMEVGFVVAFELLLWLSGVDSFENAQSAEVFKRDLHVTDGIRPRFVLGGLALDTSFNLANHFYN